MNEFEHIFRAYDVRGIYNQDLTIEIMTKIGLALGTFVRDELAAGKEPKEVVVGNDIRATGDTLSGALIAGLLATGVKVTQVGTTSFGVTLFTGWQHKQDVSAYITASHLPPEWNGLKLYFGDGVGFPEENILALKKLALSDDIENLNKRSRVPRVDWDKIQPLDCVDYKQRYIEFMAERFKLERPLKTVLDCGNGSMCLTAPETFTRLGMETIELYCDVDPRFPNRPSEPTPENLTVLSETVRKEKADFGVAFDGDGDRTVIVDNTGRVLSADPVGIILGKNILALGAKKGNVVLANVESSMAIEKVLEPLGAKVSRIRVGHTFLTLEAKKQGAVLGIERSGHLIMPEYFLFDDAMITPLRVAEILSRSERPLAEYVDELPLYPKTSYHFDCPDAKKFQVIENLQNKFAREYDNDKVNTLDGVRVDLDEGWGLIRASNTSPVIRVTVEAVTEDELKRLSELFNGELKREMERA